MTRSAQSTVGVIGVGHLASSIVAGLMRAGWAPKDIHLSPRGMSGALSARFGVSVAASNAALVQACSVILLSVRPAQAVDALTGLPWRSDHIVASACAGVRLADLEPVAAPARVSRIMPITSSELGASPTPVFPARAELDPLLTTLGTAIPLTDETQFEAATVSAAVYGWVQKLVQETADWSTASGLPKTVARALTAHTFVAAGRMMAEKDEEMNELIASLCTPGGITEAGLKHLADADVPDAWRDACDLVLGRLRGGATHE